MKAITEITNWLSPHGSRPSRRQRSTGGFFSRPKLAKQLLGLRRNVHTECIDLLPGLAPKQASDWSDLASGYLSPKWTDVATSEAVVAARMTPQVGADGIAWLA